MNYITLHKYCLFVLSKIQNKHGSLTKLKTGVEEKIKLHIFNTSIYLHNNFNSAVMGL